MYHAEKENKGMEFSEEDRVSISNWHKCNVIGRGSYGVVYLGVPTKAHLGNVAIKVALYQNASSLLKEKTVLENFIGDPEIVQYIGDAFTHKRDDYFYNLILEYAPCATLSDLIKARGKLAEDEVREYLRMILRGLSCIHAKGFVHSDLKPGNILAFPIGGGKSKLKIADFGVSERYKYKKEDKADKACHQYKFRGTPRYMSPESLIGEIKPSLDIWSLGCVLINMISGKRIWTYCKTNEELLSMLVIGTKIPNIPKELSKKGKDFLQKCFERNAEQRWTADMLLKHPYLVEDQTIKKKKSFKIRLPNYIGFCTMMRS